MNARCFFAVLLGMGAALSAQGQWIIDDSTNITSDIDLGTTSIYIGNANSDNEVDVFDSTLIAGHVAVGYDDSSDGNELTFDDESVGLFYGSLYAGYASSDNLVEIQDGSVVTSYYGFVGYEEDAESNRVVVTDSDSHWYVATNAYVGGYGSGNSLTVEDDASMYVGGALITGWDSTADGNSVLVSDGDLEVNGELYVGVYGSENRMDITNGATVTSGDAYVGWDNSADDNLVYVSDGGSWTIDGTLTISTNGNEGNFVVVTNGGAITLTDLEIYDDDNGFLLSDGGMLTVSNDFNASMTGFSFNVGGSLYVEGTLTGMTNEIEGARTLGIRGEWDQTGSNVTVGAASSNNTLIVENGGEAYMDALLIGSVSNSGNAVLITDSGRISVSNGVVISGTGNTLTVEDAGVLEVDTDFDAGMTGFTFGDGGVLELTGILTGMTNELTGGREVHLSGASASWDLGAEALSLDDGTVDLSGGAVLDSTGATLESGSQIDVNGSTWNNAGTLTIGEGDGNALSVKNGGLVVSGATLLGGAGSSNRLALAGSGSALSVAGALTVGGTGSENLLTLTNAAVLTSSSAVLGGSGTDNWVQVSDWGSAWTNSGDLMISGAENGLIISDGGWVDTAGLLSLDSGAKLELEDGGQIAAGSYFQASDSVLQFNSLTNVAVDPGDAVVAAVGSATIESNATFRFTGSVGDAAVGITNSQKIVSSTSLTIGSGSDLDALVGEVENGLLEFSFFTQDDDLFMQIYRMALAESAGFDSNSQLYAVAMEIDDLASAEDEAAIAQLNLLGEMDGAQQNAELSQLYDRGTPSYMHMQGMFEGMRQVQSRGVMPDTYWSIGPRGPQGPHLYGEQAQFWVKGYGSWGSQDADGASSGYDQSVYGMVVGYDKAFGDLLMGLAGGYSSSSIDQDDGDTSDAGLGYGILYGSWGTLDWFADASLAYGFGSVEGDSGTSFDASSDTDLSEFGFYLGGGKEMVFREDTVFLTPTVAMLGGRYAQDGYTEKSSNSVGRKVEDYSRWSFQSDIGAELVFRKELDRSVLMPDVHAKWLHEFNTDEDSVGYRLVGGTGSYSYTMTAPVADLFEVGAGLSLWTANKGGSVYEFALGYDARFGSGYMANILNARLNIEF